MAFPQVAATNNSALGSNGTTHTINLPSGIVADSLVIVFVATDGDISWSNLNGFTELKVVNNGTVASVSVMYKFCTGAEGSTVDFVSNESETSAHLSWRITGEAGSGTPPSVSTGATNTDEYPDPDSLDSGSSKEYLWIAVQGNDDGDLTSAYSLPDNNAEKVSGGSQDCHLSVCSDELEQQTLDPGTFTLAAAEQWAACTVAVHPSGATAYELDAETGTISLSGIAVDPLADRKAFANTGAISLSGIVVNTFYGRKAQIDEGHYLTKGFRQLSNGDELSDNFNDDDITNWTINGSAVAENKRVKFEVDSSVDNSDRIHKPITERTEYWQSFRIKFESLALDNNFTMEGSGFYGKYALCVWNNAGTNEWRLRFWDDVATPINYDTGQSINLNQWYEVLMYWKASTGVGQDDGIAKCWIKGVLIHENTGLDTDTLSIDRVILGNYYVSTGTSTATFYQDNIDVGTSDKVPANLKYGRAILANAGAVNLSGIAVNPLYGRKVLSDGGSYSLSGLETILGKGYPLPCVAGAYSLNGIAVNSLVAREIDLVAGGYSLTGIAINLGKGVTVVCNAGSITLTGVAVNGLHDKIVDVVTGSHTLNGSIVDTLQDRKLGVEAGAHSLSGNIASLEIERKLEAGVGAIVLTGTIVDLIYSGTGDYTIDLNAGSISINGITFNLLHDKKLEAALGSITLTGTSIDLSKGVTLSCNAGGFSLSGIDVNTLHDLKLAVESGVHALSGLVIDLLRGFKASVSSGSMTLTGTAVGIFHGKKLGASGGTFTLTGEEITLEYTPSITYILTADGGVYELTGGGFDLTLTGPPVRIFDVDSRQRIFDVDSRMRVSDVDSRKRIFDVKGRG